MAASIPYTASAEVFTLNDLFRSALQRSETIKIAEEDLYLSRLEKDKALSVLLPTLSAFGSHTRYSEKKTQLTFLLQPDYTNEWGLRLDQSLSLSGREYTAYTIARDGILKSTHDLTAVRELHLLKISRQYYTLLTAKKAVEIAKANVERLTKYRDAARIRLKVGEVTKTVLLRAEAELAGAESDLIKSENNMRIATVLLAKSAGIDGEYDVAEPRSVLDFNDLEHRFLDHIFLKNECAGSKLDCLKAEALSERAEIKSLEVEKKIANDNISYAKGSYWPDISIEGVYFREKNEPQSAFGLNERIYGGVRVDFPFFEGGLRKAEVSDARAKLRQAQYSLSDLKRTILSEVENSYLFVKTEASVLTKLKAEVKYAEDNYNSITKQFKHGLADSIDVIDANTLLVTSERELTRAEFTYRLSILELQHSAGNLTESVINRQAPDYSGTDDAAK